MTSPCSGVLWWHFWQATPRWLPLFHSANSGLARWHWAQRRGSVSTKALRRIAPVTIAARATTAAVRTTLESTGRRAMGMAL